MKKDPIRILFLDDEPSNLTSFKAAFRREFDIVLSNEAEEALRLVEEFRPHVVFSDQRMPKMNGVSFLKRVKEIRPNAIRVLITAYTDTQEIIKAINEGNIYRFIGKPWSVDEIRQTIINGHEIYATKKKLEGKLQQLEKTNSELNRFIYSASHDLRAPLMSILGVVKLAELDPLDEHVKKMFEMIESSVLRLDIFINSIIEYYQNSREFQEIETINFQTLINEILENLQYYEGADQIKYDLDTSDCDEFVADVFRVRIILSNIISNAIKYRRHKATAHAVSIKVSCNPEFAEITVSDNGIGIPSEHQEHIFNMFYRADAYRSGSGIGLYIVKEALERLKGEIELDSKVNKGSTFTFKIPRAVKE